MKILLAVAHPDDEYSFAATIFRFARELGGTADQVVITNGEAGFRYSQLAELLYGEKLTNAETGRARLPEIRRGETLAAGQILGIRRHYFLDQQDTGYSLTTEDALKAWDKPAVVDFFRELIEDEQHSHVFVLLPSAQTHGHHKAAALLVTEAVLGLPPQSRPIIVGAEPMERTDPRGRNTAFRFDRTAFLAGNETATYQVIVNWVIAEHKTQGRFQLHVNQHEEERFWILQASTEGIVETEHLFQALQPSLNAAA
jgi:LmbE family N-acetylglucosaminyl deacetylase